jgi:hypothetical protein
MLLLLPTSRRSAALRFISAIRIVCSMTIKPQWNNVRGTFE